MRYVGKIKREIYRAITDDITTEDVVISDERIAHSNKHGNAFEKYGKYAADVLSDPDFVIADKRPNTAVLYKEIETGGKTIQLILRLHVSADNPAYKNSIISFWDIGGKRRKAYEKNGKVIYKRILF